MDSRTFSQRNSSSASVASRQSSAESVASATSKTSRRSRLLKLIPAGKRRASVGEGQTKQQDAAVDPQQLGLVSSNSDSNSLVLLDDREPERSRYVRVASVSPADSVAPAYVTGDQDKMPIPHFSAVSGPGIVLGRSSASLPLSLSPSRDECRVQGWPW
jgi:hypothetical protein